MRKLLFALITLLLAFSLLSCSIPIDNSAEPPKDIVQKDIQNAEAVSDDALDKEPRNQKLVILDKSWKAYGQYSEGLCPVLDQDSGLWGYVDRTGEYVIQPQFYDAFPFSEGLAGVQNLEYTYDFIDVKGNTVIKGGYYDIYDRYILNHNLCNNGFVDGYAVVSMVSVHDPNFAMHLIDKNGTIIKPVDDNEELYHVYKSGDILLNDFGIINPVYDPVPIQGLDTSEVYSDAFDFSKKNIIVQDVSSGEGYVVDATGQIVFSPATIPTLDSYSRHIEGITDDYIVVGLDKDTRTTYEVYDYTGKLVLESDEKIAPYSKDLFVVQNRDHINYIIDINHKEVLSSELGLMNSVPSRIVEYAMEQKSGVWEFELNGKDQYFDFNKKKIKDRVVLEINSPEDASTREEPFAATADRRYDTISGSIYLYDIPDDYSYIFNEVGEQLACFKKDPLNDKIGIFPSCDYITLGLRTEVNYVDNYNKELFLNDGIIPVRLDKNFGYTFAIVEAY